MATHVSNYMTLIPSYQVLIDGLPELLHPVHNSSKPIIAAVVNVSKAIMLWI